VWRGARFTHVVLKGITLKSIRGVGGGDGSGGEASGGGRQKLGEVAGVVGKLVAVVDKVGEGGRNNEKVGGGGDEVRELAEAVAVVD
jgi:hypothetical protein